MLNENGDKPAQKSDASLLYIDPASSTPFKITTKPTIGPILKSSTLERLKTFLPELKKANEALLDQHAIIGDNPPHGNDLVIDIVKSEPSFDASTSSEDDSIEDEEDSIEDEPSLEDVTTNANQPYIEMHVLVDEMESEDEENILQGNDAISPLHLVLPSSSPAMSSKPKIEVIETNLSSPSSEMDSLNHLSKNSQLG